MSEPVAFNIDVKAPVSSEDDQENIVLIIPPAAQGKIGNALNVFRDDMDKAYKQVKNDTMKVAIFLIIFVIVLFTCAGLYDYFTSKKK